MKTLLDAHHEQIAELPWGFLPPKFQPGLQNYMRDGVPPGDFLQAVLEDRLFEAMGRADDESVHMLKGLCTWIYSYAPSMAWGSPEKCARWSAELAEARRNPTPLIEGDKAQTEA